LASTPLSRFFRPAARLRVAHCACLGFLACVLLASTVLAAQREQGQAASAPAETRGAIEASSPQPVSGAVLPTTGQYPNASSTPTASAFSWSGYFYAIGALCLILGALWGVLWLMRRSGRFRFMPSHDGFPRDALRIEAQIPLGPRRGLMVVRFLNKRLLLGLSDQQIHLLSEADYDEQTSADFSKALAAAERQETDG
jgi:flagellar protein FliO/FliZ